MDLKERNKSMKDFFNRKIDTYDEVHEKFMDTKQDLIDAIDKSAVKILDLGAGTGRELECLYRLRENVSVTAIDISENMLEELRKKSFGGKVNIICGDFFEVEFGSDYDAVISTSALHHFLTDDKLRLYRKIYESLRENGEFINSDKIALSKEEEDTLLREYYLYKDERAHCDTPLAVETELELLRTAGFKDVTVDETHNDNYRLIKARK